MANGTFGGGIGTETDPYLVEDAKDVNAIRNDLTAHYKQVKNIDMSSYPNFVPIGTFVDLQPSSIAYENAFKGTYNGSFLSISNLKINSSVIGTGLFGAMSGATLVGMKLVNCLVRSSGKYTGSLVGVSGMSKILWCSASGSVLSSGLGTGGMVGGGYWQRSSSSANIISIRVFQSHSSVNVEGVDHVGGIIGSNKQNGGGQYILAEIEECYCTGSLLGKSYVGGLIGGRDNNSRDYGESNVDNIVRRSFALNPKIIALINASTTTFGRIAGVGTSTNNFALSSTELQKNG